MDHVGMSGWLLLKATVAERIRQGVLEEGYDGRYDLYDETESKWDYADFCLSSGAIGDIDRGLNNLPTAIQGYDI